MATIYYYVDECYREHGEYWHCNIGGALVDIGKVVEAEVALETEIYRLAIEENHQFAQGEFKYTDFFRDFPDEYKIKVAKALTAAIVNLNVHFLVSHATIRKSAIIKAVAPFGTPSHQIQQFAFIRINNYLEDLAASHQVQIVVDLGIAESFRPTYDMYCSTVRSIPMLKARGIGDDQITIAHYRNLPRPLFLDSGDSRILQYSDVLIGLLLARRLGVLTPFKQAMLQCIEPTLKNVHEYSVEWNKEGV